MNRVFKLKPDQWNNARLCRYMISPNCLKNSTHIIQSVIHRYDQPGKEIVQEWHACDYHAQNHINNAAKYHRKLEIIDGQPERGTEQIQAR